ncbi:MAG: capsid assembly protein, partial [Prevotella sp.]|nr:capsid assembly protein [Prevotella sp.]
MEEKKDFTLESVMEQEDKNTFDFQSILKTIILNWQWFLLALIISLGVAALYLRYVTPIYQARAKMLIKEEDGNGNRRGSMLNMANLGMMTNSTGIDNEMEILKSHSIAERVVRDLKLYVTYIAEGKIKDRMVYSTQPITVDIDEVHLNKMTSSIPLQIKREGKNYHITGTYYVPIEDGPDEGPFGIDKTFSKLPATISTRAGILSFTKNGYRDLKDGSVLKVKITPVSSIGNKYASAL